MAMQIECEIYKSKKKEDTYVYIKKPADLELIPAELSKSLGELEFVMGLVLNHEKKLARENVITVMENIEKQGFHLQIPPTIQSLLASHKTQ